MAVTGFGIFLLLHGIIHTGWVSPKPADPNYPFVTTSSRLLPFLPERVLSSIATPLVALIVLAFTVAGLGVLGVSGLSQVWRGAAVAGSILSLIACLVYWHPWFVAGPLLDIAIIAAVVVGWPKAG